MKASVLGYWSATALVAFAFFAGGVSDLLRAPPVVESVTHLGYPTYVATLLGMWKLLGVVAILVPRFPRLKEWAYAGITFDLTGAAFSHAAVGDGAGKILVPLVLLAAAAASWALRPESRKLTGTRETHDSDDHSSAVASSRAGTGVALRSSREAIT